MAYPMAYPMSSPMLVPPMAPQIDPSTNIPSMSAPMPMEKNFNGSFGIPQSPSFSELLSLNDEEIMTLLDDTIFRHSCSRSKSPPQQLIRI